MPKHGIHVEIRVRYYQDGKDVVDLISEINEPNDGGVSLLEMENRAISESHTAAIDLLSRLKAGPDATAPDDS